MNEDLLSAAKDTDWITLIQEKLVAFGPRLIGALILLIVGFWLIRHLSKALKKSFEGRKIDPSLSSFVRTLITSFLKILVLVSAVGMVGIEITSFIAILGAAGLAVGLALQGTLQNFAGGVILLLLKPFKVGDFISIKGYDGKVKQIQIFYTIMMTLDNKTIIIPNGEVANTALTNISLEPMRRMDWTFGVAYGSDLDKAKEVLMELIKEDERFLEEPAPFVAVKALNDSSIDFVVRAWAEKANFWGAYHSMFERVYKKFEEEGINIPYPTMTVHMHKE